jgi:hypothetical protein
MCTEIPFHLPVGGHFSAENAFQQLGGGIEQDWLSHKGTEISPQRRKERKGNQE